MDDQRSHEVDVDHATRKLQVLDQKTFLFSGKSGLKYHIQATLCGKADSQNHQLELFYDKQALNFFVHIPQYYAHIFYY